MRSSAIVSAATMILKARKCGVIALAVGSHYAVTVIAFLLYCLVALITGIHIVYLIAFATWGVPVHILEYVALAGGMLLLIAGYIGLWNRHTASQLALAAALAEWAFYLPALRTSLGGTKLVVWSTRAGVYAFIALAGLLCVTAYAAIDLLRAGRIGAPVRTQFSFRARIFALGGSGMAMVAATATFFLVGSQHSQRFDIVVPAGYQGWIRIDFGLGNAARLEKEGRELLVSVPASGVVETSTEIRGKTIANRYRYVNNSGDVKVARAFVIQKKAPSGKVGKYEYILVGDGMLHPDEQIGGDGMPIPGPIRPLAPHIP